jgi:zinc protease
VEPVQTGARRVVHRGPGATSHLELLVHAPAASDPRYPAYLVLDGVLAGGKAEGRAAARAGSRLHAALVRSGLAQAVSTEVELSEYPGLHAVSVTAAPDADLARIESALDGALAAAARNVSDDEVRAAADQVVTAFAMRDDSNRAIADRLARFEGIGSYSLLPRIISGVGRVTAAEVRTLAAALFDADRHNVGWFVPQAAPADTTTGHAELPVQREAPAAIAQRHAGTAVPPPARHDLPSLPPLSLTTRPSGLTVGTARIDGDLAHVRVRIEAGALQDPPGREGLALVTARALTAWIMEHEAAGLAARGIRLVSSASSLDEPFDNRRFVEWSASVRTADVPAVLRALLPVTSGAAPPDGVVARARDELADEVEALRDDSRWRANDAAWSALYPASHPLGRPVHGTRDSLAAITGGEVARFLRDRYDPRHATVAIAGAFTEAEAVRAVAVFDGWRPGPSTSASVPMPGARPAEAWPPVSGGGRHLHVALPHKDQASIAVALPAAGARDADHAALSLLNYLLGETGYAGRLGETLVDTGIAYAVYASLWPYEGAGPLLVTTDAVQSGEAVERIRAALAAFSAQGLTAADLDEAKGFVLGRMLYRFETPAAASGTIADLGTLNLGADGLRTLAERVRSVTLEQLNAAAARYYDPRHAVFVVAGADRFRSEK